MTDSPFTREQLEEARRNSNGASWLRNGQRQRLETVEDQQAKRMPPRMGPNGKAVINHGIMGASAPVALGKTKSIKDVLTELAARGQAPISVGNCRVEGCTARGWIQDGDGWLCVNHMHSHATRKPFNPADHPLRPSAPVEPPKVDDEPKQRVALLMLPAPSTEWTARQQVVISRAVAKEYEQGKTRTQRLIREAQQREDWAAERREEREREIATRLMMRGRRAYPVALITPITGDTRMHNDGGWLWSLYTIPQLPAGPISAPKPDVEPVAPTAVATQVIEFPAHRIQSDKQVNPAWVAAFKAAHGLGLDRVAEMKTLIDKGTPQAYVMTSGSKPAESPPQTIAADGLIDHINPLTGQVTRVPRVALQAAA